MKGKLKNISIRKAMIIIFIVAMLIGTSSVGYVVFYSWFSSAKLTTQSIAEDMNEDIQNEIYTFLQLPAQIINSNNKIISNSILDLSSEKQRDQFFAGVLSSCEKEIYSFSYGSANGEYYGARRNTSGSIEIMRNNTVTGGESWYYAANEDFSAGELVLKAGQFDARTRSWYIAAAEKKEGTFSEIYKHFVMDDLAVSYSYPIYGDDNILDGVLGAHLLLTDINSYLNDTIKDYNGYAIILEKNSGKLVANSMYKNNFADTEGGDMLRYDIDSIEMPDLKNAYENYKSNNSNELLYMGKAQNLYINIKEIQSEGIDWVVISAIPQGILYSTAISSIIWAAVMTVILSVIAIIIFMLVTKRLINPMHKLLQATAEFSSGDFSKRIEIVREDEIGKISKGFNDLADKMQFFVNNLEATVKQRTEELYQSNITLEDSKEQLRIILDTAAEGIYGIDLEGNCVFCNLSCIKLLGYKDESELLGQNMHWKIHHTKVDGTRYSDEECRIFQAMKNSVGSHVDDEVFYRKDGSFFYVDYYAYPQIKNQEVIGAVVTFTDITDRKRKEEEIRYLNCHDVLTGLHNRRCFEENRDKVDIASNLPLSVIFGDINGLKMTNDIFGHAAGDELIKKSAQIIVGSCKEEGLIARVGGDEFIVLLPKTTKEEAALVLSRIRNGFIGAKVEAIKCSIALGLDTKESVDSSLDEIMANAENAMYKDKSINRKTVNKGIIDTLIDTLHSRNVGEKEHSVTVAYLCEKMGNKLGLDKNEISKLKRAGYLHDIGKIVLEDEIMRKKKLSESEQEKMRQHSVVGYRILNLFDDTLDLAEYVYGHHEKWDGSGYPRGLSGDQIPLISRIIAVVEGYERLINKLEGDKKERKAKAIQTIVNGSNIRFDPKIVEVFVNLMQSED